MGYTYRGTIRDVEEIHPEGKARCGTNSGYMRHGLDKTTRCQPCKDAHAAVNRKHRNPVVRNQCATYSGYMRHKRAGEDACDMCRAAYARYMADYRAAKKAA